MDILSWEIAKVVPLAFLTVCDVIRVFLLLGNVCLRHPPYQVLPSCPLLRAFPYPQLGDAGGHSSAPAICQSLTSADPILYHDILSYRLHLCSALMLPKTENSSSSGIVVVVVIVVSSFYCR